MTSKVKSQHSTAKTYNSNIAFCFRKRKRAPLHLSRINLNSTSAICSSNESLNSGLNSGNGSDEETLLTPLSHKGKENAMFLSSDSEESEKRLRLCSHPNSINASSHRLLNNVVQYQTLNNILKHSTNNSNSSEDYDLAELECSQAGSSGSTSSKSEQKLASGGLVVGNGEYELVGDGAECKAVNIRNHSVYHCLVLKPSEYKKFLNVMSRLKLAEKFFDENERTHLKNSLIPDDARSINGNNGFWYLLLPDHYGNLHSLIQTRLNNFSSDEKDLSRLYSEQKVQPIFKQIVALVHFCHKIGLYFRDFRLRKFVFVDRKRSVIRLNNVLDLWAAPDIGNDRMTQRYVCPAYVAPEILDIKASAYAGQPADVWALGVLMFILLTGRYPFYEANPNPMALFKRIKARRFSFPVNEYISPNARWLLHGILRLDPLERPTVAEILSSHWLQVEPDSLPEDLNIQKNNIAMADPSLVLPHSLVTTDRFIDYFA